MAGLWVEFMNFLTQRMVNVHRNYMIARLEQLAAPWSDIVDDSYSTQQQRDEAAEALPLITKITNQISSIVYYDTSLFQV